MLPSFSLSISESHSISVCTYQGNEYDVGDNTIPAGDDCNVCTCNDDGTIICGKDICGKKICLIYMCKVACNFVLISTQNVYMILMLHSFRLLIIASHSMSVCTYQGIEYDVGDNTIPAGDHCNVCTCNDDGNVVCGNDICGKYICLI